MARCPDCGKIYPVTYGSHPTWIPCGGRELPDPAARVQARHHANARDTEVVAAQMVTPRAGTMRAEILNLLYPDHGYTHEELATAMGRLNNSVSPRVTELTHMGWIHDSGIRRLTPTGAPAIVWILTDRGKELLGSASSSV